MKSYHPLFFIQRSLVFDALLAGILLAPFGEGHRARFLFGWLILVEVLSPYVSRFQNFEFLSGGFQIGSEREDSPFPVQSVNLA